MIKSNKLYDFCHINYIPKATNETVFRFNFIALCQLLFARGRYKVTSPTFSAL